MAPDKKKPMGEQVGWYVRRGWRVVYQDPFGNSCQLVKPKRFSFLLFVLLTVLTGVGGVLYLLWYWTKTDDGLLLQKFTDGSIKPQRAR